jgi:hypothetical protein
VPSVQIVTNFKKGLGEMQQFCHSTEIGNEGHVPPKIAEVMTRNKTTLIKLPGHHNKNEPVKRDIIESVDRVVSGVGSRLLGVQALENLELIGGCCRRNEPDNDQ